MKKRLLILVPLLVFLAGLSVLLYPIASDFYSAIRQKRVILDYSQKVSQIGNEEYAALLEQAREYNRRLLGRPGRYLLSEADFEEYSSILNVGGDGVIGVLEIPNINVKLPIYHTTNAAVLEIGVGHYEGTSFPVGGPGTHAVVTGHRGLPSATLLSELDLLTVGSRFIVNVLDETLTYEVDQSLVILPDDIRHLEIVPGEDYMTVFTCTPYGINTHRLLVRGHRISNGRKPINVRINQDARQVDMTPAIITLAAFLLIVFSIDLFRQVKSLRERR